jgi:hypothetical protein
MPQSLGKCIQPFFNFLSMQLVPKNDDKLNFKVFALLQKYHENFPVAEIIFRLCTTDEIFDPIYFNMISILNCHKNGKKPNFYNFVKFHDRINL